MKTLPVFCVSLLVIILFNACSKEETNDMPTQYEVTTQANITSFSKNYGYTDETITIFGENFTTNATAVSIKFDDISATIVSASNTEIKCILPETTNKIPVLDLKIQNRNISNLVTNDYQGNIGILPKRVYNTWIASQRTMPYGEGQVQKIKMIDSKKIYCNISDLFGGGIYRTLDEGIKWIRWTSCPINFGEGFFVSTNDDGFSNPGSGLNKVPVGGNDISINLISNIPEIVSIASTNNLQEVTLVNRRGLVHDSYDGGVTFTQVYTSTLSFLIDPNNPNSVAGQLDYSFELDKNHIWVGGSIKNIANYNYRRPVLVYKNQEFGEWKEYLFPQIDNEYGRVIKLDFVSASIGYALIESRIDAQNINVFLYKSTNGGDSWSQVYNNEKFSHIVFKDANTGWAIVDTKIYKTTNGGISWQVEYISNTPVLNISYADNMLLAFTSNQMLQYNFQ